MLRILLPSARAFREPFEALAGRPLQVNSLWGEGRMSQAANRQRLSTLPISIVNSRARGSPGAAVNWPLDCLETGDDVPPGTGYRHPDRRHGAHAIRLQESLPL